VDILRPSLKQRVRVHRVRLVYQGGGLLPKDPATLDSAVNDAQAGLQGVEVLFQ
jgi:hypothetical protein